MNYFMTKWIPFSYLTKYFLRRSLSWLVKVDWRYFLWLFQALREQQQYLGLLGQLKDYDEELTQELEAKAYQEQEKQRLEVELASLLWAIIYVLMNYISLEDFCSIALFTSQLSRWYTWMQWTQTYRTANS